MSQHFAIPSAMFIYVVYLTYCKTCDRLLGYKIHIIANVIATFSASDCLIFHISWIKMAIDLKLLILETNLSALTPGKYILFNIENGGKINQDISIHRNVRYDPRVDCQRSLHVQQSQLS